MKANMLGFGLLSDTIEAPALWGARAIFTGRVVDFLWDRQALIADETAAGQKVKANLIAVLNGPGGNGKGAISGFKLAIDSGVVDVPNEGPPATLDVRGARFHFSERGSHGYLYVTAHLL
jgi:hypothetical protein